LISYNLNKFIAKCHFIGYSKKDGKKVVESDRIKVINDQAATGFFELVICQVNESDAGEYTCKALNRFGEATSTAKVTVTSRIVFIL
jgi:hypothetical protein